MNYKVGQKIRYNKFRDSYLINVTAPHIGFLSSMLEFANKVDIITFVGDDCIKTKSNGFSWYKNWFSVITHTPELNNEFYFEL